MSEQPAAVPPPGGGEWRVFLLQRLDAAIAGLLAECASTSARANTGSGSGRVRHPLSGAVPLLSRLLDMPTCRSAGDHHMPHVQDGSFGASERFAVSPGRESDGYLELPGGPSGHPLSPFYRSGFEDWARGKPTPFLPGPAAHKLVLRPDGAATRRLPMSEARFSGTDSYVATPDLMMAVNAAVTLGRPLLIKGEPGTGKTQLASEIARALKRPLYEWHIKSTSKAQHGLYEYDAVSRLRDSQLGDEKVRDIRNYIVKGSLWEAFESAAQPVLLIDEIDKADIEFPERPAARARSHGVLRQRDARAGEGAPPAGHPHHQQQRERAAGRVPAPLLLPLHPFSRRRNDGEDRRGCIIRSSSRSCCGKRSTTFFNVRETPGLRKKPSTSELLDWIKLLLAEDIPPEALRGDDPKKMIPRAARRAAQERAGRAPVRATRYSSTGAPAADGARPC